MKKVLEVRKKGVPLHSRSDDERDFLRSSLKSLEGKYKQVPKKVQETRASILKGIAERRDQARIISVYTKKSLILA
ncbi:MAG: hypothetical protein II383_05070, partial [Bacteroidales bacterium]|nr:hypothetical protein [Bacteroidales bacterium]